MKLSIVSTLFKSEPYIREFHRRISASASSICEDYEIVLVNDGSPDDSLHTARTIQDEDPEHVSLIDFSRNFGHHAAMMCGLEYARGDYVFLIDIDLEEEPELLLAFWEKMQESQNTESTDPQIDVVYGVQQTRKGMLVEKLSGKLFYFLYNKLAQTHITPNLVTTRLMTRRYVDALLLHHERELFVAGLWHSTGFLQIPMEITKHSLSETSYTFRRKLSLLFNSIISFSARPLELIFFQGITITFVASIYVIYLIVNRLWLHAPVDGWTSLMVSIWFLGGVLLTAVGTLGLYTAKIFSEIKQRPRSIVREYFPAKKKAGD